MSPDPDAPNAPNAPNGPDAADADRAPRPDPSTSPPRGGPELAEGSSQDDGPQPSEPRRAPERTMDRPRADRKPDDAKRAVALVIDAAPALIVGMVPVVGGLAATGYWLVRDGLDVDFMRHRSLGKQLTGLKPVRLDGQPMDIETSIRRNWPFAVGALLQVLAFIPIVGWLLMIPVALVALGLGLTEIYLAITDDEGRRLGDRTGGTRVVDVGDGQIL